ncbi:helix-turn-helix domain-containing protein [Amycolatopsis sp. cmx-4-68]|uniref:helix-turn-helix domain-containing protein n=1 Tax=Amycolatopsis sp. cmx-4-68 TaxID=2790938 RepID=UPI00397C73F0
MLLAARRWSNTAIAAAGVSVDTVRTWRGRFAAHGLAGLADRARSAGRRGSLRCRSPRSRHWRVSAGLGGVALSR